MNSENEVRSLFLILYLYFVWCFILHLNVQEQQVIDPLSIDCIEQVDEKEDDENGNENFLDDDNDEYSEEYFNENNEDDQNYDNESEVSWVSS